MYLNFSGITKHYGAVTAVRDISFVVNKGEFVSLLGPSGCGKTTTLMLLAGFETPDSGRIRLDGQDLAGLPPEKREVGVVFQNYALFPHMNVVENIAFGLVHGNRTNLALPAVQKRVSELLEMVDLTPLAKRKPHELSAGQQQRVAIARSLAPYPRVLCFDEPLSALDALLREKLRLDIHRLQRKLGLTVLYVTHDQEEALAISDRVVVMDSGRIMQVGTPWKVYDRPANQFVAGFIGQGALLEGRIRALGAGITVEFTGGRMMELPLNVWCGLAEPSVGELVNVVLRAERMKVGAAWVEGLDEVEGRLDAVEFLGGLVRLHIASAVGAITAVAPATNIVDWQRQIGAQVIVRFRPDDVRLVPVDV